MTIAAAGGDQVEIGRLAGIAFTGLGRMAGMPALQAVDTGIFELTDEAVIAIETRMGQHCDSAGLTNQPDGIPSVHAGFGHKTRAPPLQELVESLVMIPGEPLLDEGARNVQATGRLTLGQSPTAHREESGA